MSYGQGSQIRQIWRIWRQNCSLRLQKFSVTNREPLPLQKFLVRNTVLSLPFLQQIQFTLIVNVANLNYIIEIKELYRRTKQEEGSLLDIWAFQVSGPPQLLRVSLTIVYTCQDHVLESLKMAFFVVILDSKYSKMTPKFVKQKSHWLHSSIKFANPDLWRMWTYDDEFSFLFFNLIKAFGIQPPEKSPTFKKFSGSK